MVQLTIDGGTAVWPDRCLTDGRVQVLAQPVRRGPHPTWLQRRGREWRGLRRRDQWVLAATAATGLASPFGQISVDAQATALVGLAVAGGVLLRRSREPRPVPVHRAGPTEAQLARSGSPEALVAGAATRAWGETLREPAWRSPQLAVGRAVFDGASEVDQIVEVALRIHGARRGLGERPPGAAGVFWDQQQAVLDRSAAQLGTRADALIRFRDHAAALSAQLAELAQLERLERSAVVVDGLATETAVGYDAGLAGVTEQIAGVRAALAELVDGMTRRPLVDLAPAAAGGGSSA